MMKDFSKKWDLENLEVLTETPTSTLFKGLRYGEEVVLKVLNAIGLEDEVHGASLLSLCQGKGAVELIDHDESAHLLDYLPGHDLYQFSKEGEEEKATSVFISLIKKIQSVAIPKDCDLPPVESLFPVLDTIPHDHMLANEIRLASKLAKKLTEACVEKVLLHGDLHHENIKLNKRGEYNFFDPKGFIGDPCYELGTTLKNPWLYSNISCDREQFLRRGETFSKELNLPIDRIISYAYIHFCLSYVWSFKSQGDTTHQETLIKMTKDLVI